MAVCQQPLKSIVNLTCLQQGRSSDHSAGFREFAKSSVIATLITLTKGRLRAKIALEGTVRGLKSEQELETKLIQQFGELYVHTEKRFGTHKNRVDFMVFTPDGNFGIDIFFSGNCRFIQSNLNIKIPHYDEFPRDMELYFVSANPAITEEEVLLSLRNMNRLKSRPNIHITDLVGLVAIMEKYRRYDDPENFKPSTII
jgi:hypothetical protein